MTLLGSCATFGLFLCFDVYISFLLANFLEWHMAATPHSQHTLGHYGIDEEDISDDGHCCAKINISKPANFHGCRRPSTSTSIPSHLNTTNSLKSAALRGHMQHIFSTSKEFFSISFVHKEAYQKYPTPITSRLSSVISFKRTMAVTQTT